MFLVVETEPFWGSGLGSPCRRSAWVSQKENSHMLEQHGFKVDLRKNFQAGLRDQQVFKRTEFLRRVKLSSAQSGRVGENLWVYTWTLHTQSLFIFCSIDIPVFLLLDPSRPRPHISPPYLLSFVTVSRLRRKKRTVRGSDTKHFWNSYHRLAHLGETTMAPGRPLPWLILVKLLARKTGQEAWGVLDRSIYH
jgi:hypothetical protein